MDECGSRSVGEDVLSIAHKYFKCFLNFIFFIIRSHSYYQCLFANLTNPSWVIKKFTCPSGGFWNSAIESCVEAKECPSFQSPCLTAPVSAANDLSSKGRSLSSILPFHGNPATTSEKDVSNLQRHPVRYLKAKFKDYGHYAKDYFCNEGTYIFSRYLYFGYVNTQVRRDIVGMAFIQVGCLYPHDRREESSIRNKVDLIVFQDSIWERNAKENIKHKFCDNDGPVVGFHIEEGGDFSGDDFGITANVHCADNGTTNEWEDWIGKKGGKKREPLFCGKYEAACGITGRYEIWHGKEDKKVVSITIEE